MLELKELRREYERGDFAACTAVNSVDLTIKRGDFLCILGRSGSGKSTLLNMTAGLLRPTSGKIIINGVDLWSLDDKAMARIRNLSIGYIPQGPSLISNLTILDNVRLPLCLAQGKGSGIKEALELLEQVGLKNLAEGYPFELSGGEMRRAAIARALINNPEIMIADEPTGDLDEETAKDVMKLFKGINSRGTTILMVTHDYDITGCGNRLCVMSAGKLTEKKAI